MWRFNKKLHFRTHLCWKYIFLHHVSHLLFPATISHQLFDWDWIPAALPWHQPWPVYPLLPLPSLVVWMPAEDHAPQIIAHCGQKWSHSGWRSKSGFTLATTCDLASFAKLISRSLLVLLFESVLLSTNKMMPTIFINYKLIITGKILGDR